MNRLYHKMLQVIDKFMSNRYIPTWVIASIDAAIVILSVFISGFLIDIKEQWFNFPFDNYSIRFIVLTVCCTILSLHLFKIHRSVIRYSSFSDMMRILLAISSTAVLILIGNFLYKLNYDKDYIPKELILVNACVCFIGLFMFRMFVRWLFEKAYKAGVNTELNTQVIIFGAGRTGTATANTLVSASRKYYIKGFIDDDPNLRGKTIMGQKIYPRDKQEYLIKYKDVDQLIIATNRISTERKNEIFELCHANGVKVLTVPPIKTWTDGKLQDHQIKEIQLEDLLGRAEITINRDLIEQQISGKTILISGAAGSIGSEIVRQLARFSVRLVLLDQAETPMYHIENELNDKFPTVEKDIVIASVTDQNRLREIFNKYKPQVVFHAAAYKHVPMMEREPYQAANNNIIGTKYIADISMENKVEKFIMISTDKAVNPTNVMGASKRYAEIYIQHLNLLSGNKTKFITTRFGNVLGSNGSVIPRFKEQIRLGGPVTVTHPDITRYFMTIPEASRLVLEAGTMGNGGEIFLFDMGEPVKILSLAERMIKLSGLKPEEQIKITFSGLRPGEKLYEELLTKKEDILPTYHKKIYIAKTEVVNSEEIDNCMEELQAILSENKENQDINIVRNIKRLVKTFKSNNSIYEELD
ncbi:MAG: nucleoside-diphosphate sugar epimerase/dehydratase, partial [Bacteroidales bacterium]|nr:nucleoside-diphosphate sugar epimerase/dehydratase [Bacteroidales bacterium]